MDFWDFGDLWDLWDLWDFWDFWDFWDLWDLWDLWDFLDFWDFWDIQARPAGWLGRLAGWEAGWPALAGSGSLALAVSGQVCSGWLAIHLGWLGCDWLDAWLAALAGLTQSQLQTLNPNLKP